MFESMEMTMDDQEETVALVNSEEPKHSHKTGISDWQAGVSLAKAIMGAGSFALPWAFAQMGYLVGPLCLGLLGAWSVYTIQQLVQCARLTTNSRSQNHSYVQVARATFGTTGATLAYGASVSASIGVCGSYLVFIAANLESLLAWKISQNAWVLVTLPVAVALSSVRNVHHFAFASLLGDISVVLGMLVVLIYGIWYHQDDYSSKLGQDCVVIGSLQTMPLAFGAIGYLFLVHFLSLPIESSMARPDKFPRVARVTFVVCALLSGSFGVLGYLLFGSRTEQIVLLNVIHGSFFVSAVKLLLCVDLLFTYPVVMKPSIVILEQTCFTGAVSVQQHGMVCGALGVVAASCSMLVPAFGVLSGLVGGVSQTFLAFVLPPLMLAQLQHPKGVRGVGIKGIALVSLGVVLIQWTLVSTWNKLRNQMG